MKKIFTIISLVLLPMTSSPTAVAAATVYQVEVLVFENKLPDMDGAELWTREQDKSPNRGGAEAVAAAEPAPPESALSATAAALESTGQYHVLAHLRWQQSAEAKSVSKPVRIGNASGELDGTLRFYLSRFLQVDTELALRQPPIANSSGSSVTEPAYRIGEHRRIKTSEVHYFDHPKFGALVRVVPTGKK